ncbi:methionine/alanine import family NSS transporter small subunit [Alteribacillus iranensis]|uniref:Putative methionine and alanine importer, small subunit n=1 Tax=Alteribacillus iranensis TaxID=930128 RepID=A0A1I2EPH8_9BACI|nr:methionine/alanine import family NSS transporter small subunit [Alteribacillus iranensis]SFE94633.1 Putative methionine and alanine importer, small subunit [Alteribacillus iranensis]
MTASAIAMMIIGMIIIWGGMISSMVYARQVSKQKNKQ